MASVFPPIDESVLTSNPNFAALHKTLTTRILNPDGSTTQPGSTDGKAEALKTYRLRANKIAVLISALEALPLHDTSNAASSSASSSHLKSTSSKQPSSSPPPPPRRLPPEQTELILLLSATLSAASPPSASALRVLSSTETWSTLNSSLPKIGALLSHHLHQHALLPSRLLHPRATKASSVSSHVATLPTDVTALNDSVTAKKAALATARASLVPVSTSLLSMSRAATSHAITGLERTKHGTSARSAITASALLATLARVAELDAGVKLATAKAAVYTPEVKAALGNYREHLRMERSRLRERRGEAEKELGRYGVGRNDGGGKERVMREVARAWGEMSARVEEVRRDVERLKGR